MCPTGSVVAAASGAEVKTVAELKRDTATGDLSRSAAVQAFSQPVGKAFSAPAANNIDRLVARVTAVNVPPFVNTTQEAAQMEERLKSSIESELLTQYVTRLQNDLGVSTNERSLRIAIGGGEQ